MKRHDFDPQYFCEVELHCCSGREVPDLSVRYSAMKTIEITRKVNNKTDKIIKYFIFAVLLTTGLSETPCCCSNASIFSLHPREACYNPSGVNTSGCVIYSEQQCVCVIYYQKLKTGRS